MTTMGVSYFSCDGCSTILNDCMEEDVSYFHCNTCDSYLCATCAGSSPAMNENGSLFSCDGCSDLCVACCKNLGFKQFQCEFCKRQYCSPKCCVPEGCPRVEMINDKFQRPVKMHMTPRCDYCRGQRTLTDTEIWAVIRYRLRSHCMTAALLKERTASDNFLDWIEAGLKYLGLTHDELVAQEQERRTREGQLPEERPVHELYERALRKLFEYGITESQL